MQNCIFYSKKKKKKKNKETKMLDEEYSFYSNILHFFENELRVGDIRTFNSFFGIKRVVMVNLMFITKDVLPVRDLLLVLYHLKNNNVFSSAHETFKISYSKFHKIFWESVQILLDVLPDFDFNDRLNSFYATSKPVLFENVYSIIDATECRIENPVNRVIQNYFYSGKKKYCTIKYQVIIDFKSSKIIYVSEPYSGRNHDLKIFRDSLNNLNQFLLPNEKIMGDKAYCSADLSQLFITPIKKNHSRLNIYERIFNKYVSHYRIHIEHVFARIKKFRILKNNFRYEINSHSKIFYVCCKLVNFFMQFED
jgi:hypothetical protein